MQAYMLFVKCEHLLRALFAPDLAKKRGNRPNHNFHAEVQTAMAIHRRAIC